MVDAKQMTGEKQADEYDMRQSRLDDDYLMLPLVLSNRHAFY